ncbi:MAG: 3'-5' exonuclease [Candidatus Omnitrophica bacterium]|nr:3'-5' exonuclease [Candidatus Omnitrophota bacterium]
MDKNRKNIKSAFNRFAAIDFETADYGRDSACSISIVIVEKGEIVKKTSFLIRPPRRDFVFSYLHGISWRDVEKQPDFIGLWPKINKSLKKVEFIAAHNASFDRGVLRACCAMAGITPPDVKYLCTMKLARYLWGIYPTKLPDVCRHFDISFKHHNAESDATACANIVLKALKDEIPANAFLGI